MFNVNPNKSGYEAFNVGTSNLMGHRALSQMFKVDEITGETVLRNMSEVIAGRTVKMFDVVIFHIPGYPLMQQKLHQGQILYQV